MVGAKSPGSRVRVTAACVVPHHADLLTRTVKFAPPLLYNMPFDVDFTLGKGSKFLERRRRQVYQGGNSMRRNLKKVVLPIL